MGQAMSEAGKQKRGQGPRDGAPKLHGSAVTRNATLGRFTELRERVQLLDSSLGDYSYIERDSEAIYTEIGKFCAIAAQVRLNALNHPMDRISQHKITYRPNEYFARAKLDKGFREKRIGDRVVIGHDVWIGHGATVLPGVTIGHGAVVGGDEGRAALCDRRGGAGALPQVAVCAGNRGPHPAAHLVGLGARATRQGGGGHAGADGGGVSRKVRNPMMSSSA